MNKDLNDIYSYLKNEKLVKTKKDFAEKTSYNYSYISELFNDSEAGIPEKLRLSISSKFGIDVDAVLKTTPSTLEKHPKSSAMSFKGGFLIDFIKRVESGLFPVSNQDIQDMKEMAERWAKEAAEKIKK